MAQRQKKVLYHVIDRSDHSYIYEIMDALVAAHHSHLAGARIAIAWRFGQKPDKDGHLELGKCKKASDLNRDLHQYNFVILLNFEAWNGMSGDQRRALMDHELSHAETVKQSDGEDAEDEGGRTVYRIRKHDIEEFREVIARHGLYKRDLEDFAKMILEAREKPLLQATE